ncbi:MAG: hypothetical protein ACT4OT_17760 [Acidobacteriota bacterium]
MEHIIENRTAVASVARENSDASRPAYQAYQILHVAFIVAPIVAGLDKFFNLLVNWEQYLPPFMTNLVGANNGHYLMMIVGVVEIVAGLGVAFKPRVFAYVVAAWLLLIIANLLMIPGFYDVALRDFGLALAALALARLSREFGR